MKIQSTLKFQQRNRFGVYGEAPLDNFESLNRVLLFQLITSSSDKTLLSTGLFNLLIRLIKSSLIALDIMQSCNPQ